MTVARVVAVPFRGLKGHRSEKMTKTLIIFNRIVTQRTFISEILREISYAIGILKVAVSELVPLKGVYEFEATSTK